MRDNVNQSSIHMKNICRLAGLYIIANLVVWILLNVFCRSALPLDVSQAYRWSEHLAGGYSANPYLVGWISHLGFLTRPSVWGYYSVQYLCVAMGMVGLYWLAWRLFQQRFIAALSVLALGLTLLPDYNIHGNNDSFLLIALWPWLFFVYLKSLQNPRFWVLTGLLAGLSLMSKYSSVVFLLFMLVQLLICQNYRQHFKSIWLYCGVVIFVVICLPNLYWVIVHHFQSFEWFLHRTHSAHNPLMSLGNVIGNFYLIALIPLIFRLLGNRFAYCHQSDRSEEIKVFQFIFIWPTVLTVVVLLLMGNMIYAEWMYPYAFLSIPILFTFVGFKSPAAIVRFRGFLGIVIALFCIKALLFALLPMIKAVHDPRSRALFPAQAIARSAVQIWQAHYETPLPRVGGSTYVAGSVAFYAGKPVEYASVQTIQQKGGIVIGDKACNHYPVTGIKVFKQFLFTGKDNKSRQSICFMLYADSKPVS